MNLVSTELSQRGYEVKINPKDIPDADILCFNKERTQFAKLIVKTFKPGDKSCVVGVRSEKYYANDYFWVLAGVPMPGIEEEPEYYIIPNNVMVENAQKYHRLWVETPGKHGQPHKDTVVRVVLLPPSTSPFYWDVEKYLGKWEFIDQVLSK